MGKETKTASSIKQVRDLQGNDPLTHSPLLLTLLYHMDVLPVYVNKSTKCAWVIACVHTTVDLDWLL